RHDTLGGACATESNMVRYALDKRHMHACRQSFVKAIGEWGRGLDKRDIANRGAIACRIIRTLRRMGVSPVAVYSDADRHAAHVAQADAAVRLGPPPA